MLDQAKQDLYKEVQQAYYNAVAAHENSGLQKWLEAAQLAHDFEEQNTQLAVPAFIRLIRFGYVWQPPVPKRLRQNTTFVSFQDTCFYNGESL